MQTETFKNWTFEMSDEDKQKGFERHAQTVAIAIVIALIMWVGSAVQTTGTEVAVLKVQIKALEAKIDGAIANRFTADDGKRLEVRINTVGSDLRLLEDRVRQLENGRH